MMVQSQGEQAPKDLLRYTWKDTMLYIEAIGRITAALFGSFLEETKNCIQENKLDSAVLFLSRCAHIDSTIMGNLVAIRRACPRGLFICQPSADALQALDIMGLLSLMERNDTFTLPEQELISFGSKEQTKVETVYSAHRLLMEINPENNKRFAGLMNILESEYKRKKS